MYVKDGGKVGGRLARWAADILIFYAACYIFNAIAFRSQPGDNLLRNILIYTFSASPTSPTLSSHNRCCNVSS